MAKVKSATPAKNATTAQKADPKKLTEVNLQQFAQELESKGDKVKKVRETIYIYPENFIPADINSPKGKQHRSSLRNKLNRHSNNIFAYSKTQELGKLKAEIELFDQFYLANFKINDYSLESITQSTQDSKARDLQLMLNIIKECKAAK